MMTDGKQVEPEPDDGDILAEAFFGDHDKNVLEIYGSDGNLGVWTVLLSSILFALVWNTFFTDNRTEEEMAAWARADAYINELEISAHAFGYDIQVLKFSYSYRGKSYESDNAEGISLKQKKELRDLQKREQGELTDGKRSYYRCYVNPEHPEEAKLIYSPPLVSLKVLYALCGGVGLLCLILWVKLVRRML